MNQWSIQSVISKSSWSISGLARPSSWYLLSRPLQGKWATAFDFITSFSFASISSAFVAPCDLFDFVQFHCGWLIMQDPAGFVMRRWPSRNPTTGNQFILIISNSNLIPILIWFGMRLNDSSRFLKIPSFHCMTVWSEFKEILKVVFNFSKLNQQLQIPTNKCLHTLHKTAKKTDLVSKYNHQTDQEEIKWNRTSFD